MLDKMKNQLLIEQQTKMIRCISRHTFYTRVHNLMQTLGSIHDILLLLLLTNLGTFF